MLQLIIHLFHDKKDIQLDLLLEIKDSIEIEKLQHLENECFLDY